jgi:hypothetical protein
MRIHFCIILLLKNHKNQHFLHVIRYHVTQVKQKKLAEIKNPLYRVLCLKLKVPKKDREATNLQKFDKSTQNQ